MISSAGAAMSIDALVWSGTLAPSLSGLVDRLLSRGRAAYAAGYVRRRLRSRRPRTHGPPHPSPPLVGGRPVGQAAAAPIHLDPPAEPRSRRPRPARFPVRRR